MTNASDASPAIAKWYESLTPQTLSDIRQYYASDARFKDPFNDVRGIDAIERIFRHMFEVTSEPRFTVLEHARSADAIWLYWVFYFGVRGRPFSVSGASRLVVDGDGRIVEHLDFWDPISGIWRNLPLIGWAVRWRAGRFSAAPAM